MVVTDSLKVKTRRLQGLLGVAADGFPGPVTIGAALEVIQRGAGIVMVRDDDGNDSGAPMFDARTESYLSTLSVEAQGVMRSFVLRAKEIAGDYGVQFIVIGGTRGCAEQDALYAQGRSKPGAVVTNAKCGQSDHNYGIAIDGGIFDQEGRYLDSADAGLAARVYRAIGLVAPEYGVEWGGDWTSFKDYPHFALKDKLKRELAK